MPVWPGGHVGLLFRHR